MGVRKIEKKKTANTDLAWLFDTTVQLGFYHHVFVVIMGALVYFLRCNSRYVPIHAITACIHLEETQGRDLTL